MRKKLFSVSGCNIGNLSQIIREEWVEERETIEQLQRGHKQLINNGLKRTRRAHGARKQYTTTSKRINKPGCQLFYNIISTKERSTIAENYNCIQAYLRLP